MGRREEGARFRALRHPRNLRFEKQDKQKADYEHD
jgi:hypothetical protein